MNIPSWNLHKLLKKQLVRPHKVNYMFLRHFFLENDAGGRLFIFYFFELNTIKRYPSNPGKIFDF